MFLHYRQPVEIKLFTNTAVFKDAVSVLVEAVNCPVLEVATEAVKAVAALLRMNILNDWNVAVPSLGDSITWWCFRAKGEGHAGARHQKKAVSRQGQFIQSALESFRNACRLAVECQNDPLAQENPFTAPNSEKKDTLKSFSEFLLRMSDSLCIPIVMNYSERIVRPALMEVFISTLNILFSVVPDMGKRFSIKLEQEISELLQKNLPQLNFGVAESLTLLSETPSSYFLDDTLRSHQYSLLLLFYFAFSQEDSLLRVALAELIKCVSEVVLHALNLIVLGDFNIHIEASLASAAQVVMTGYPASH
ncbi:UNVERIFIED_CONTAM: hypothetical protein K2H54_074552 [Gekko kuhli]